MSDLCDKRDGLESLLSDVTVVALRPVPLPLELKRGILVGSNNDSIMAHTVLLSSYWQDIEDTKARYLCHVLSTQAPVRLGPLNLARVPLHLEVLVAF